MKDERRNEKSEARNMKENPNSENRISKQAAKTKMEHNSKRVDDDKTTGRFVSTVF
jgi:hypothetical protein